MLNKSLPRSSREAGTSTSAPAPMARFSHNALWFAGALLLLVVAGMVWFLPMQRGRQVVTNAQPILNTNQIQDLIAKVSMHIQVKEGEQPTVATIQEVAVLRAQNPDFYKDAQNGDRLLIWSDKAVLYSTKQDKLLAVLPIRLPATPAPTTPAAVAPAPKVVAAAQTEVAETPSIEVRNGTSVRGLAQTVADRLKAMGFGVAAVASTQSSPQTLIIVKAGKTFPKTVQQLIEVTKGKVATLPEGESAMKGDVLVVVGADYQN